jgi:CO/xanthine dehydrogenase Mo-binding subunit
MENEFTTVGKRVVRSDSLAKVTGEACYTADIKLPGMLAGPLHR